MVHIHTSIKTFGSRNRKMAKKNALAESWIQETFDLCAHV